MKITTCASSACLFALLLCGSVVADEFDTVPGAIWRYEMTPNSEKLQPIKGSFRVKDKKIFQRREGKPTEIGSVEGRGEYSRKDGKLPKKGDRRRITFDSLGGSGGQLVKAKGFVIFEGSANVTGRLTDSEGNNWQFKATRVRE